MSPIVKPPVTTIGTVAMLLAVEPIVAFVKFVAVNVFPQVTIPVLKLFVTADVGKAAPHLLEGTTLQ